MKRTVSEADQTPMPGLTIALVALAILLAGCNDAHPLYGPNTPRDGLGRPVDPVYGTPLPGTGRYY